MIQVKENLQTTKKFKEIYINSMKTSQTKYKKQKKIPKEENIEFHI